MLDAQQREQFDQDGFVILRRIVSPRLVAAMSRDVDAWIDQSRRHACNFGPTPDGKMRFDLEAGHSAAHPKLRRVANPADLSENYQAVLWDGPVVDAVAALIGPDVKFHHCKLNIKLPGMRTRVDYHQDHAFDPHTNDDHVVALVLLDPTNLGNGCLRIVPGSHNGPRHSHYDGEGRFVGKVDGSVQASCESRSVPIEGDPGDVCLMSGWSLHGGGANTSDRPRRLLICDYFAADAFALLAPMVPSVHTGRIVRGTATRMARFRAGTVELPSHYEHDSFFGAQGQQTAAAAVPGPG